MLEPGSLTGCMRPETVHTLVAEPVLPVGTGTPVVVEDAEVAVAEAAVAGRHSHRKAGQAGSCIASAGREHLCTGCFGTVFDRCRLRLER